MRQDARIKLLGAVWLFERCSRKELAVIASHATPMQFEAGKVLAREGAVGREFFVVIAGKVEATRNGVSIGVLGPGSFFGEMALLEGQPRVATVVAVEPTEVLVLTTQGFAQRGRSDAVGRPQDAHRAGDASPRARGPVRARGRTLAGAELATGAPPRGALLPARSPSRGWHHLRTHDRRATIE